MGTVVMHFDAGFWSTKVNAAVLLHWLLTYLAGLLGLVLGRLTLFFGLAVFARFGFVPNFTRR